MCVVSKKHSKIFNIFKIYNYKIINWMKRSLYLRSVYILKRSLQIFQKFCKIYILFTYTGQEANGYTQCDDSRLDQSVTVLIWILIESIRYRLVIIFLDKYVSVVVMESLFLLQQASHQRVALLLVLSSKCTRCCQERHTYSFDVTSKFVVICSINNYL